MLSSNIILFLNTLSPFLVLLTRNAGTEGDENNRGDRILDTQSATEIGGNVADYRSNNTDP